MLDWTSPEPYQALADLKIDPNTQLHIGVVNDEDDFDGAERRTEPARSFMNRSFGVSTECPHDRYYPDELSTAIDTLSGVAAKLADRSLVSVAN